VLLTFERDHWPKYYYVQEVDRREMTRFTLMQTVLVAILVAISRIDEASLAFPFIMASMIPMRIFIVPKLFSKEAIDVLDR
jgi:hydrogenase-4 membrane subunit HyfE